MAMDICGASSADYKGNAMPGTGDSDVKVLTGGKDAGISGLDVLQHRLSRKINTRSNVLPLNDGQRFAVPAGAVVGPGGHGMEAISLLPGLRGLLLL
jgi:hypothetical protein